VDESAHAAQLSLIVCWSLDTGPFASPASNTAMESVGETPHLNANRIQGFYLHILTSHTPTAGAQELTVDTITKLEGD
jgi:hypothetical protein